MLVHRVLNNSHSPPRSVKNGPALIWVAHNGHDLTGPFREVVGLDLGAPGSRAGGGRSRQQGRGLHRQAATGAQGRWAEQVDEVLEAHLNHAVLRDHNVITNVPETVRHEYL